MKNKYLLSLFLLLNLFFLIACDSNTDRVNLNSNDIISNDTSATTGSLRVDITYQGNRINNAEVKLYPTNGDVTKDQYLFRIFSNSSGSAFFGYLNYDNYYVQGTANISGTVRSRVIPVQVQARKDLTYELALP